MTYANVVLVVVLSAVVAYRRPGWVQGAAGIDSATSATHFVGPAVYGC